MTATREMTFLLAEPERRLLMGIAARVPAPLRPNHFTVLGVMGAVGAGAAYALSTFDAAWLWVASFMLAVNWLGDSLDGTLARVRNAQRPRYGYYIDHAVDAFNTAVVGIGIGLSPYVSLELALLLVVLYLALSINVYLESQVFGTFRMGHGKLGPTEVRLLLMLGNTLLAAGPALLGVLIVTVRVFADWTVALIAAVMLAILAVRFGRNLYVLARLEPQRGLRRR